MAVQLKFKKHFVPQHMASKLLSTPCPYSLYHPQRLFRTEWEVRWLCAV